MDYFGYGSNLDQAELTGVCPSAVFTSTGKLVGYRLDFTRYSEKRRGGVADIVKSNSSVVWGAVYEIPADEWHALDRKEGAAAGAYKRTTVNVRLPSGESLRVTTYMVVDKAPPTAPSQDYLSIILRGAKQRELPTEYVESIVTRARELPSPGG